MRNSDKGLYEDTQLPYQTYIFYKYLTLTFRWTNE